jgi:STAS domain-containing protein
MSQRKKDVSIEAVHEADRSRVIAEGEMDMACVVALNRAMSEATARDVPVDLDLSGVTFVDSRFTAAVGGWERDLGPSRFTLELPPDVRLQRLLALRSRRLPRARARPTGRG